MLASLSLVLGACGSSATPSPSSSQSTASTPPATGSAPAASGPAASANPEDLLFKYDYAPVEGTAGGTVVLGEWQPPATLNTYYNNSGAIQEVIAPAMRPLWTTTSDGHWKPDLAAKMPMFADKSVRETTTDVPTCAPIGKASPKPASKSGFEMDIELRPDLKWSDGEPLTTDDIKYTWTWNIDPAQTGLIGGVVGWEDIASMDIKDATHVTVKWCRPYAGFYGLFGGTSWLIPKHYFETIPVAEADKKSMSLDVAAKIPTSGPYKFQSVTPNGATLVKNDKWTGGFFKQGSYLETIKWSFFATVDGMKADFLNGNLDLALNMVQADYDSIKGVSPDIGKAIAAPAWEYEHIDIFQGQARADSPKGSHGTGLPLIQDLKGRVAIEEAIDKAGLFNTLFPGAPLPEKIGCAAAPPGLYFRDETVTCPAFDAAKAKADLSAAGWTDSNGDGTIDKGGAEAVLEGCTTAGRPVRQLTMEKVSSYLKDVGIKVNLTYVDATSIMFEGFNKAKDAKCSIYGGNYDLALYTSQFTFDLFGDYYTTYHSSQNPDLGSHGGTNTTRINNPELDKALDTIKDSINSADQILAAHTVQKIAAEQVNEIGLYYRQSVRGVSTTLQNFFKNPSSVSDVWNSEDWWAKS
jgi:peptide/nickel transport system substrate-binding protein